ncbi:Na+/Ca+ antiporter, CaCA family protein [Haloterrigena salina JCM 13891]|uniref:Na+/Ca+ antiporter, CaCA family protein n=1 Tax=Haloterrigena salina JCM 13891 TaxID=1227488 RepID=M0BSW8_9EURY|nr:calcium/sodium antiporter [Haloterrigena salina]ELZ13212.1 Na+/Ca+ antiporter, CaCA family protein [Haloterrigena salina JCM 13891]
MVQGGLVVQIAIVGATVLGLWLGARTLVDAVVRLARRFGVPELTIGLTIVAMGTSTPELVVSTDAAFAGSGEIAVGNVIGSNIYNLAVVLGAVSLLAVVPVERSLVHRDGIAALLATLVGFGALFDRTVTRGEGLLLVALFVGYTIYVLRDERTEASIDTEYPDSRIATSDAPDSFRGRDALALAGGLILVLLSGHFMVEAASAIARTAGVSDWVIGGTIVAAGTSTPELAVSLVAMRRGHVAMSVGNALGSNIFNVLGVLGLASLVGPLAVGAAAIESLWWLTAVTAATVGALWSGRRLSRPEGGLLVVSELVRWTLGLLRIFG